MMSYFENHLLSVKRVRPEKKIRRGTENAFKSVFYSNVSFMVLTQRIRIVMLQRNGVVLLNQRMDCFQKEVRYLELISDVSEQ